MSSSSSGRSSLDPSLASILDSIRATVAVDRPAPVDPAPPPTLVPEAAPDAPAASPPVAAPQSTAAERTARTGPTVEEFLAELIRPQVKAWLDANLPELIQKMASDEIARLIGRD